MDSSNNTFFHLLRVNAENNIKQRADRIKKDYKRFHLVVMSGGGKVWMSLNDEPNFARCTGQLSSNYKKEKDLARWVKETLNPGMAADEAELDSDDELNATSKSPRKREPVKNPSISEVLTAIVRTKGIDDPIAVIGFENHALCYKSDLLPVYMLTNRANICRGTDGRGQLPLLVHSC